MDQRTAATALDGLDDDGGDGVAPEEGRRRYSMQTTASLIVQADLIGSTSLAMERDERVFFFFETDERSSCLITIMYYDFPNSKHRRS
jgi:hypothetical protein